MRFLGAGVALSLAVSGASANLNELAKAAGLRYFGSATDNGELSDTAYVSLLKDATEFGQITPANSQKWQSIEPSQDSFEFEKGDQIVDFAEANGQMMRCHNLVWYSQLPSWVSSTSWTTDQLTDIINTHISNEVGHYKGQCYAWDVVNEALNDNGTFRNSVFFQVLGSAYIPLAFKAAAAADPDAKLYYNDYSIETVGAKQKGAVNIVTLIKEAGARIDGVGMQGHFTVGSTPSQATLLKVMSDFVSAGASEVAFTELDIRFTKLPATTSGLQQQATDYGTVTKACLAVKECIGITVWDFTDKYSWIPSTFRGSGAACLLDENLNKKPAYDTVAAVLSAAATTGSANSSVSNRTRESTTPITPALTSGSTAAAVTGLSLVLYLATAAWIVLPRNLF